MRLSKKYLVPTHLALLYEFLNSTDRRTYPEKGKAHAPSDEWETPAQLESWLRRRGLLKKGEGVKAADHRRAQELRSALRGWVECAPESRGDAEERIASLNQASAAYPLIVKISKAGRVKLQSVTGAKWPGRVLGEFLSLAESGRLERLKMCSSPECQWVFFDRSKPGSRRWCSSTGCGNRQKTRDYRKRVKDGEPAVQA